MALAPASLQGAGLLPGAVALAAPSGSSGGGDGGVGGGSVKVGPHKGLAFRLGAILPAPAFLARVEVLLGGVRAIPR